MSVWSEVFLGVIAVSTVTMAIVQVQVLVTAARLARRVDRLAVTFEHELKPLCGHMNAIGRDLSRTTALATAQVERADRLFSDLAQKMEQTLATVQSSITGPAREGQALLAGLRAAMAVISDMRRRARARQRAEEEDALFI